MALQTGLFSLLFAFAVCLSLFRLYIGVDLYDESYCMAFLWRFALGDRPYIDEVSFHQNFAVLFFPLAVFYKWVVGSSDGLVLAMRWIFTACRFGVVAYAFISYRRFVSLPFALGFATLFLLSPTGNATFTYASIGFTGFFVGSLALLRVARGENVRVWGWIAGISHAVGMASDPSTILACLWMAGTALYFTKDRRKFVLAYCIPPFFLAATLVSYAGPKGMAAMWEARKHLNHAEFTVNFFSHVRDLLGFSYRPYYALGTALVLAAYFFSGRKNAVRCLVAFLLPILVSCVVYSLGYGAGFYFAYFGLAALPFFLLLPKDQETDRLFWLFWVPSLVCGISYTWTGNIGGINRLGPGMVLAVFWGCFLFTRMASGAWAFLLTLTLLSAFNLQDTRNMVAVSTIETRVPRGPFRGLWTDSGKAAWIDSLDTELKKWEKPGRRILVHPHLPAGFLFTSMPPATLTVWWSVPFYEEAADLYLEGYTRYHGMEKVAVNIKQLYYNKNEIRSIPQPPKFDKLLPFMSSTHHLVFNAPTFDIYLSPP